MMQLWGANNYRIDVTYDRIVPDAEHNVVVVDLLETVVSDHALQTAKPGFVSTADLAASFDCHHDCASRFHNVSCQEKCKCI